VLQGKPLILIDDGNVIHENLRRQRRARQGALGGPASAGGCA
jgi:hypothetical protein